MKPQNNKGRTMRWRADSISLLLVLLLCLTGQAQAQDKFKLKAGAKGKNCLNCHDGFEEILKSPFVHTPVKGWECTGCHNPHASAYGKFLDADPKDICLRCHTDLLPAEAKSTHAAALQGGCVQCHDPHAAKNRANLLKAGSALCSDCHKELVGRITAAPVKHSPVEKGCENCHDPHASTRAAKLLKEEVPGLCLKCHDPGKATFAKQHMDYPMAGVRCTSCHNPHGSSQKGLLYDKVHAPFAGRKCNQCHEGPASATPLKLKAGGFELCRGCHSNMINEALAGNRLHWPLLDRTGCLNCHNPHAADEAGLLKGPMPGVCGACHMDTVRKLQTAKSKHPPVEEGDCMVCHAAHAANEVLLLKKPSLIDLCGECHDWQKHSTHPIGEKAKDPRNPNLTVTCQSCHRAHGTDSPKMLHAPTQTEMCTNCHKEYRR
jgi:predicted CXXCH cytochrome family protein